jgi:tripartite ATP-independent transporter DctP family solute receptor
MKTNWVHGAAVAAGLALAAAAPSAVWAQEKFRIAGNFTDKHSSSIAIDQFKKDVEAATGGKLVIEDFPEHAARRAQENVTQSRAGTINATWVGMAFLSRTVPELEAVSLPFLFPNREVAYKVMDGQIGDADRPEARRQGLHRLGFMELGARQVTNSVRPIKTMADLKGLKIRLQPNETHLATFRALGANPLAMDIREVYSAMEQKVIDGHENPYNLIFDSRFYEVQKYVSNTGHFFDFIAVVANRKKVPGPVARIPEGDHDRDEQGRGHAARGGRQGRRRGAGRVAEEGHAVRRDAGVRARGDAQGHRRCGRGHQEARRGRAGRPRAGRSEEGLWRLSADESAGAPRDEPTAAFQPDPPPRAAAALRP